MKQASPSNDKPKLILLGAAVVIALVFIVLTLVGANSEVEEKVEADDVFLALPTATVNSGVMLLWSVKYPLGRNPFDTDPSSSLGFAGNVRQAQQSPPTIRPVNPNGTGSQGNTEISKTVVLKAVVRIAGENDLNAIALIEIEGQTSYYKIGDKLMSGVTVVGMFDDGVMIDVNGEVQQLRVGQYYLPDIPSSH